MSSTASTPPQSPLAFATNVRRGCRTTNAMPIERPRRRSGLDRPETTTHEVRFRGSETVLSSIYRTRKKSKNRHRWYAVPYGCGRNAGGFDDVRTPSRTLGGRAGGPLHLITTTDSIDPSSPSPVSCSATSPEPDRQPFTRKNRPRHKHRRSTKRRISSAAQIHCDDALINRIMKGKKSRSPRWRKRTRAAAASFGFRLEGRADLPHPDFLSSTAAADRSAHSTTTVEAPLPPRGLRRVRRPRRPIPHNVTSPHDLTPEQYDARRNLWASRYTSLPTLRSTFGTNRNKLWGDFDPSTTRRLYNTLLPRALLGLYEMGLGGPKDLAPLAYEARMTAKKYARERCVVPGRVVAMMYDGFRSWREWGTWNFEGMSWEQIWYKYETQILQEMMREDGLDDEFLALDRETEELTAQICLRILERSCITNARINELLIHNGEGDEKMDDGCNKRTKRRRNAERYLGMISSQLDKDMEELMEGNGGYSAGVEEPEMHPIINYDPLIN